MLERILIVGAIIGLAGLTLWNVSKARCFQLIGEVTRRVETDIKVVAQTFDDGPRPEGVDAVHPLLAKHNANATFFLIVSGTEEFAGQAERLLAAGHESGNHAYTHQRNIRRSHSFYVMEIAETDRSPAACGQQNEFLSPSFSVKN